MPLDAKALADVTAEIVTRHVAQATAPLLKRIEALESRPLPERGEKGDPGESIRGETGVGVAGALIDRSGVLILTLTDGTQRDLGPVVGKDGRDGEDGEDGADGPPGEPGKDGRDGFNLADFDANVSEDGRTIEMAFADDTQKFVVEMKFPVPIYRGVFKEGEEYEAGDMATWGGSLWHCKEPTTEKPDAGPWQLAVKKGRDGKDAK